MDTFIKKFPQTLQFEFFSKILPYLGSDEALTPLLPLLTWLTSLKPFISRLATQDKKETVNTNLLSTFSELDNKNSTPYKGARKGEQLKSKTMLEVVPLFHPPQISSPSIFFFY